ncbi:hypothetical protein [Methylocystis sp. ATCC 49242]|uniref:hypothetical protein n=1 Tax=Methylocystis sp. ATCC 49242 TaxID=622637 RepID=UPI0001F86AB2|nr:hypothetical protein [Methylocystis sp. ATCC 49242]
MSCKAEVTAFVHSPARIESRFDGRPFAKLAAREKHGRAWNVVAVEDAVRAAAMALRPGQRIRVVGVPSFRIDDSSHSPRMRLDLRADKIEVLG